MRPTFAPILSAAALLLCGCGTRPGIGGEHQSERWRAAARHRKKSAPAQQHAHRSRTQLPFTHLGMNTGKRDIRGRLVRVRCASCHATLKPRQANAMATRLERFHRGVVLDHGGESTCRTCHNPPRFESFRLGSGRVVPYAEVIDLCGQCHSRQRKDYEHGIHGGMRGYWDLDRGGRDRNHCLDCHDPHHPAIPEVLPAPRARYRFLDPLPAAKEPRRDARR